MLTASKRIDKCPTPGARFSDKFPTAGTDKMTKARQMQGGGWAFAHPSHFWNCFVLEHYLEPNFCAFHKHANSKVQKPPSQLRFLLLSIISTITTKEPWNTETHKTDQNTPITDQKPWHFEPVKVKFCFLRGPLSWLTAAKNAILNFRIRVFLKSAGT